MSAIPACLAALLCLPLLSPAQTATPSKAAPPLPYLSKTGAVPQLMVDGKPFIMLAGELHNSSASSIEYMRPIWNKLAALHLNTVISTVSWELLEPQEGRFDFTLVDAQLTAARQKNLRLVLIWFASWKNASSSYAPGWVKTDLHRFPRIQSRDGVNQEELTPLGEASAAADAKAFRALMRHLRAVDPQHTVIMIQVENETGLVGDSRDRSALAEAAWSQPVPGALMNYLQENKAKLLPEVTKVWSTSGFKAAGTWPEVFGTDAFADELFMAWYVGRYVDQVTAAGKAELALPMYANAWLVQRGDQLPGGYPSGGPVSRVADIWRAAAPHLDLLAPDIYLSDFKGICASYARSGNPLFIPEARANVGNLFWALGRHAALGYSPFGIDSLNEDNPIGAAYQVLQEMLPVLGSYQAEGKVTAILQDEGTSQTLSFAGYKLAINFSNGGPTQPGATQPRLASQGNKGYALIIATAPDEFLVVGSGLNLVFTSDSPGAGIAAIATAEEGRYSKGRWLPGRRFNGDETNGATRLQFRGDHIGLQKVKLYRHE